MKPETIVVSGLESGNRLKALRQKGWENFKSLPWPVKTDEEWRRTDPEQFHLETKNLQPASNGLQVGWEPVLPEWIRMGVILTSLHTALKQFPELVEQVLGALDGAGEDLWKIGNIERNIAGIMSSAQPPGIDVDQVARR